MRVTFQPPSRFKIGNSFREVKVLFYEFVIIFFLVGNHPGPVISIFGFKCDGKGSMETAAVCDGLADDRLFPTFLVKPIKAFSPKVDATIELHFF